jgi:hypothetical protein
VSVLPPHSEHQHTYHTSPITDVASFTNLSLALEGGGVSAYSGALKNLTDDSSITAAGTILSTEGRHAAFIAAAVGKENPWSGPFDVGLHLFIPT